MQSDQPAAEPVPSLAMPYTALEDERLLPSRAENVGDELETAGLMMQPVALFVLCVLWLLWSNHHATVLIAGAIAVVGGALVVVGSIVADMWRPWTSTIVIALWSTGTTAGITLVTLTGQWWLVFVGVLSWAAGMAILVKRPS